LKKRILLFTSAFPYGTGEQFIEDEINFLANDFNVEVIPFSYGKSKVKRDIPQNIKIHNPLEETNLNFNKLLTILFKSIVNERRAFRNLKRLRIYLAALRCSSLFLSNNKVLDLLQNLSSKDIIYFYWGHISAFVIPFLRDVKGKIVIRLHRTDLYEYLYDDYYPFREKQLRKADFVIPISNDGAKHLLSKYPFVKEKIFLNRLGIINDDDHITPKSSDGTYRIVSVSSLTEVKRVDLIVEILKYITNKKIVWTHFGDGPLRSKIEKEIFKLPSNIKVDLKGHKQREEIFKFYKENPIDVFINVSFNEGIPVSIMEAISFGIPILATAVGGVKEIVSKEIGILIPRDFNPKNIAQNLEEILTNMDFDRKKIKEFWRENYNARKNYSELVNFFKDL